MSSPTRTNAVGCETCAAARKSLAARTNTVGCETCAAARKSLAARTNAVGCGPCQLRACPRPHARTPPGVKPVQLRANRRPSCLSPWSSGNPVQLRTTRVGLATCHPCGEIPFDGMVGHRSREYSTNKKRAIIPLCYLNRILAAAPHVAPPWYAHTPCGHPHPPHPRQCAVRGQAGG